MARIKSWIPNIFTLGNLSLGFFSVLLCFQNGVNPGILSIAGLLILLAALLDGLDGFAARLLNAQSELGAQLDTLADLTTFGIAPGVLMYTLVLQTYSFVLGGITVPLGAFIAVIFPVCAAYRLARFNVQHATDSFSGLPSPVAGVIVGLMPLAFTDDMIPIPHYILTIIFVLAGFLMVSTVRYAKPQVSGIRAFTPQRLAIVVVFLIGVLIFIAFRYSADYAAAALFCLIVVYIMSGLISLIVQLMKKYRV